MCTSRLMLLFPLVLAIVSSLAVACEAADDRERPGHDRYVLVNVPARDVTDDTFRAIKKLDAERAEGAPRLGVGSIISYLRYDRERSIAQLRRLLHLCREHQLAVIVQLDGEQWWQNRPDLWNWWDSTKPGFDPANAANVEWSGWGPEHALRISWRNWGQQIRVLPPPNLMSVRYRAACHEEMDVLLREINQWQHSLSDREQWLLVGVKVGWESAIGMSNRYYPNGNSLIDADPKNDPHEKVRSKLFPGRGFQPIGYAAVSTAGLAESGDLQEAHLAEIIRRHLDDLASVATRSGIPREQVFTHGGGWAEGEMLYAAAVNAQSCPGWSFYRYGRDPQRDKTAMAALANSDAPFWAVAEWLPIGVRTAEDWRQAITNCLGIPRCRYLCAYNWSAIERNVDAQDGICAVLSFPLSERPKTTPDYDGAK